jgi:hypothetical protein
MPVLVLNAGGGCRRCRLLVNDDKFLRGGLVWGRLFCPDRASFLVTARQKIHGSAELIG